VKAEVFPASLRLSGLRCLLVGSGQEAERRAAALVEAGARLRVASEKPPPGLRKMAADGALALAMRGFEEQDLEDVWLVVLTDSDPELAATIATAASKHRIFFCAVDQPEHSTFHHPAVARSGPVVVAVSTSGAAPALSRRLREELERVLDDAEVGAFVEGLVALRSQTPSAERRAVLGEAVANIRLGPLELSPLGPVVIKKDD
jgi:uroporphyrin-III C-methyltransferase/precorrin-2 dehydrogenase/sirohydrochlorin ferrochelatase